MNKRLIRLITYRDPFVRNKHKPRTITYKGWKANYCIKTYY